MKLKIIKKFSNCRALWTNGDVMYVAKGLHFWSMGKGSDKALVEAFVGTVLERLLSYFRLSRQFLRIGIHHLWPLPGGTFLVIIRKRAFIVNPTTGKADLAFRFPRGNKPAHKGVCVTQDGHIFMGEYVMNLDRKHPISLYRSLDCGKTFNVILTFRPGEVRHIHFIQWDPYEDCLWMGTGDADKECRLFKSTDKGDSWKLAGSGSQFWRAVGVCFKPDALFWGTDAGSDAGNHDNFIIRYDKKTGELTKVIKIQGPCHGTATLKDGTIIVSTGVEGGINEKDRCAHLWASKDGLNWQEIISFRKDFYPFLVQYGVLRFPQGLELCDYLIFTGMGLFKAGEKVIVAQSPLL